MKGPQNLIAIPLEKVPKFNILIDERPVACYNPLLEELELKINGKTRYFRISELLYLSSAQVPELGLKHREVAYLILFCKNLPRFEINNTGTCKQSVVAMPGSAVEEMMSVPGNEQLLVISNGKRRNVTSQPAGEKMFIDKTVGAKSVEQNFLNSDEIFTKPEIRVQYLYNTGRNKFYINFCYLINGIPKPFHVPLKKVNEITDINERHLKAMECLADINQLLLKGQTPYQVCEAYAD